MNKKAFILLLLIFGIELTYAQDAKIQGIIIDRQTKEPLPFVNITFDNGRKGTVSDIDGKFEISPPAGTRILVFSYVGYESYVWDLSSEKFDQRITVQLKSKPVNINEVSIYPAENPAHRIINKVIENRDQNNPEKMRSFSYTAYNKMYFTGVEDTLNKGKPFSTKIDSLKKDSITIETNEFLNKHHLMLMEYVSQRNFKYPGKNHEKVLSSRVSGLKDPMFVLLATQMQSFSFYNEFFTIFDKRFLNPISNGSTSKYFFLIEDTFYTQQHDTLFVISYRPRKGKNFEGLKGVLYINSNGYAIQNVLAEPVSETELFGIKIQQQYEFIENKQWFPTQLNTDLLYKALAINTGSRKIYMAAFGKSYISDIKLEPNTDTIQFSNIEMQIDPNASGQGPEFWDNHRAIPLSKKDSLTYQVIDSIGKAIKLDEKMKAMEMLMFGYIPWGKFNIDFRKLIGYNQYEGFRTGLGLATNNRLISFASIGGFFTYGFKDENIKYGFFTEVFPKWYSDTKLTVRYAKNVTESGKISFLDEYVLNSTEFIKEFYVRDMNKTEEKHISFSFRALQYLKLNLFINHASKTFYNYSFDSGVTLPNTAGYNLNFTETGMQLKLAFGEKFMKTPRGMLISLGTKYPVLWVNIIKGAKFAGGDFNYMKYEAKLSKTFITKTFGKSQFQVKGAIADGNIPISNLYSSQGCHINFSYDIDNQFNTIRPGEFYSSEFLALFFRQNFGSLLFSIKKFKPEIVIIANAGWGKLKNAGLHQGIAFKTMEKGYYETGLLINRLITSFFTNIGFGVYYRLGEYSFIKTADNFTYKFTMGFNL